MPDQFQTPGPLNEPQSPISFNQPTKSNKTKWIIAIVSVLLLIGGALTMAGGNLFQGKISLVKSRDKIERSPTKTIEIPSSTTTKSGSSSTNPKGTEPNTNLKKPADAPKNDKQPPADTTKPEPKVSSTKSPIFNPATIKLIYTPQIKLWAADTIYYEKDAKDWTGTLEMAYPEFDKNAVGADPIYYDQKLILEACKGDLSKCSIIFEDTIAVKKGSPSIKVQKLTKEKLYNFVQDLGVAHGGKISFKYSVADPTGVTLPSNVITFTLFDENGPILLPSGQTLFKKETFTMTPELKDGGYKEYLDKIIYDHSIKSAISLVIKLPEFDVSAAPNVQDKYFVELGLNFCNSGLKSCKPVGDGPKNTLWVFSSTTKFQSSNTDQYKTKYSIIQKDKLVDWLKNGIKAYDTPLFFQATITDPTGTIITSNPIEIVIDDQNKADLFAEPLKAGESVYQKENLKFNSIGSYYELADDKIKYVADKKGALNIMFNAPTLKSGVTSDQYSTEFYLDYCNKDLTNCKEVSHVGAPVLKKYDSSNSQERQFLILDDALDQLVKENPDKSWFRLRFEDTKTGEKFYGTTSYELVAE